MRDRIYLAYRIQRFKIKGTGVRGKANPDGEPDLYAMEWVGSDHNETQGEHQRQEHQQKNKKEQEGSPVTPDHQPNEISMSLEPTPIASTISTVHGDQKCAPVSSNGPCMLAEFGRTFFALDSVSSSDTSADQEPIPVSSSSHEQHPSSWNDFCDPLYMDRALNEMFQDGGGFYQNGDMDRLLHIVLQ